MPRALHGGTIRVYGTVRFTGVGIAHYPVETRRFTPVTCDLPTTYHHGVAELPDGWCLRRVRLDEAGRDRFGWEWGAGSPVWHLSDEIESLTVRAPCPVAALGIVARDGWPPREIKRYNWEYGDGT